MAHRPAIGAHLPTDTPMARRSAILLLHPAMGPWQKGPSASEHPNPGNSALDPRRANGKFLQNPTARGAGTLLSNQRRSRTQHRRVPSWVRRRQEHHKEAPSEVPLTGNRGLSVAYTTWNIRAMPMFCPSACRLWSTCRRRSVVPRHVGCCHRTPAPSGSVSPGQP